MNEHETAEALLGRVRAFVVKDLNAQVPEGSLDRRPFRPNDIRILSFNRIFNNWRVIVYTHTEKELMYEIAHDGMNGQTHATLYSSHEDDPKKLSREVVI